ncbi:chaplin [Streptomyces sp. NPDC002588]|uniref:chaplin n=1 Tax=Streptomyces sp. NPDC002588 TaxID=3154419 RepID=UPI00331B5D37
MAAEKGKFMKKSAVVVAGLVLALGGAAAPAFADAEANGASVGNSGFLSGNVFQMPIHVQTNVCGNSFSVIGLLNPTVGNVCFNG